AACIAVSFSVWKPLVFEATVPEPPAPIIARQLPPAEAWVASRPEPAPAPQRHRRAAAVASARPHRRPEVLEFVLLPYGDPSMVNESATVVRVELPRSALQLAGFTVPQDAASDRVQADVLLGADGLAHAVRFVGFQR